MVNKKKLLRTLKLQNTRETDGDEGLFFLDELEKVEEEMKKVKKGDKGEKGDRGKDGKDGKDGADGKDGVDGKDGKDGKQGKKGDRGPVGRSLLGGKGPKGDDGKDGSPDTPKEIAEKLNTLTAEIDYKIIKNPPTIPSSTGRVTGGGGSSGIQIKEDGVHRRQGATVIDFSTGFTVTPSPNGVLVTSDVEFPDNTFRIHDDGDVTKEFAFEASGITTGTTRTYTAPDFDGTLAVIDTNNQLKLPNGSVGTPSLAFTTDLDTGMYSSGTNGLGFATGGAQHLNLDGVFGTSQFTGSLGINTAPSEELDISAVEPTIELTATGTPQSWQIRVQSDDFQIVDFTGATVPLTIEDGAPSKSFHIDNAGLVGVGTNTPEEEIHVSGSGNMTLRLESTDLNPNLQFYNLVSTPATDTRLGRLVFTGNNSVDALTSYAQIDAFVDDNTSGAEDGYIIWKLRNAGSLGEKMRLNSSGLGIGTTSPGNILHVSSSDTIVDFEDTNGPALLRLVNSTATPSADTELGRILFRGENDTASQKNYAGIFGYVTDDTSGSEDGYMAFQTTEAGTQTERMRIDSSGNVGIGTTSPTLALEVAGDVLITDASNPFYRVTQTGGASAQLQASASIGIVSTITAHDLVFRTSNDEKMRIDDTTGNVGIGTATPAQLLHVLDSSTVANIHVESEADANVGLFLENTNAQWRMQNQLTTGHLRIRDNTTGTDPFEIEKATPSGTLYLNSSGDVGIGTTSPSRRLSVLDNDNTVVANFFGADATGTYLDINNNAVGDADPAIRFQLGAVNIWTMGVDDSDGDKFKIGNSSAVGASPAITIDTSENVGIGTTSPNSRLDVSGGNIEFDSGQWLGTNGNNMMTITGSQLDINAGAIRMNIDSTNVSTTQIFSIETNGKSGAGTELFRINESGNVGIGTTSPTRDLQIYRTSAPVFSGVREDATISSGNGLFTFLAEGDIGAGANTGASISFSADGTWATNDYPGKIEFRTVEAGGTSNTTRMTIKNDGSVGIGTTSPATTLDVEGTIQQSNAYFYGYDTTGGTSIGTSETDVPIDTEVRKDAMYTHSTVTNNHEITIDEAGDYLVHAEFSADVVGSARYTSTWRAKVNTGGGYATVPGTEAFAYHRVTADGKDTASIHFIHTFGAGDLLKFVGLADTASVMTLIADGSRVTIQRI